MTVDVLGTEYTIKELTALDDEKLSSCIGYCDYTSKEIIYEKIERHSYSLSDLTIHKNTTIRHELIHAFLSESGLSHNSDWATNEEMVDFFALQIPKMVDAMNHLNIL